MDQNAALFSEGGQFAGAEAKDVGACLAMLDLFERRSGKRAISFHSSIPRAKKFQRLSEVISKLVSPTKIDHFHVSSELTSGQRTSVVKQFAAAPQSLITNARCLTEGVDVPAVDTVIFADPKTSMIDIVQASGRALRLHDGKEYGYIMLPLIVPDELDFEEYAKTTEFKHVARVVTALSLHDERIVEQFRLIDRGEPGDGPFDPGDPDAMRQTKIDIAEFKESVLARIWSSIGRANWRPFDEARAFVHGLDLETVRQWKMYSEFGNRPADIPSNPNAVYKTSGYINWSDWLGTDTIATFNLIFRRFELAREFVHTLKLKNYFDWEDYCLSRNKPADIPTNPSKTYKNHGWISMPDFLGTAHMPFDEARAIVRGLGLTTRIEWQKYCRSGNKPVGIPQKPERVYKNDGWISVGDWLGTGRIANQNRVFRDFKEAKKFVGTLGLKTTTEWHEHYKLGKIPNDIPRYPDQSYRNIGWISWPDWLGSGRISRNIHVWLTFEEARAFVHTLELKSQNEWRPYSKSKNRPSNIPASPDRFYKDTGWISWGDWFGTSTIATRLRTFRKFKKARAFVHTLGLESDYEWRSYAASGNKPNDIPYSPDKTYGTEGWKGMGDWLGTRSKSTRSRIYLPFEEARLFTHKLNFKRQSEWKFYSKSGKRPESIPGNPYKFYEDEGWISWPDWLGSGGISRKFHVWLTYEEAKVIVHTLGLNSHNEWREYSKSKNRPSNIPASPAKYYKGQGWISWFDWLVTDKSKK